MGERDHLIRKSIALLSQALPPAKERDDIPELSKLLKTGRKESGLTLQALADAIGFTKSYTWECEQGRCNPSTKFIWEACMILPIDPLLALQSAAGSYTRKKRTPKDTK